MGGAKAAIVRALVARPRITPRRVVRRLLRSGRLVRRLLLIGRLLVWLLVRRLLVGRLLRLLVRELQVRLLLRLVWRGRVKVAPAAVALALTEVRVPGLLTGEKVLAHWRKKSEKPSAACAQQRLDRESGPLLRY